MSLSSLKLHSFRNYRELELELHSGITVFTGRNGIGKTTILEAISILGSGRSFRNGKNLDFIRRGDETALISGKIEANGLTNDIKVMIYPQGKKIFVDEKMAKSTSIVQNLLPTIVFSPADHRIIEGDSSDRKSFLNRAAANVDWEYADELNQYSKTLLQRNRVLKDASSASWPISRVIEMLDPWNEQLIQLGARLIARRHFYLSELLPKISEEYTHISHTNDVFALTYEPFGQEGLEIGETESEILNQFQEMLKDSLRRDLASGSTQIGPHKDEIVLTLNGNKVKFYGSQGEKRTCALALRLGELALFRNKLQKLPVLLFDDVSSELDRNRRQSLVELLRKENTQVFITATELPSSLMEDLAKQFEHIDLDTLGVRE
ncbi:MAG: DNA replication/repair protein RecF [Bdellovibrionota bacterium]